MGRMTKEKKALGLNADQLNPGTDEDNTRFSEIVYKPDPAGQHRGANGAAFTPIGVSSREELAEALENGCFATAAGALNMGATPAEKVRAELAKLKAESLEDSEREELELLRAEKAEREQKKAKAKAAREAKKQ